MPTKPPTRQEIERRDSLKQYVLGLLLERADRLLDALQAFEEAARLDPDAPAVFKAQVPILLAMARHKDALTATEKVLDLDPSDHAMWFGAARLHKSMGNFKEARHALERGLRVPGLAEHPDIAQQMYSELGAIYENAGETAQALQALTEAAKILDHPDTLMEHGPFSREGILARAGEVHERIGNLYRKEKKYAEAAKAYQKAQAVSPERESPLSFTLAKLFSEQGKFNQALTHLDQYLRFQPLGLEAYEMKVNLLPKLGKEEAILPWLEQAVRADSNNAGLKVFLANQYVRGRRYAQAELLFKSLADVSPNPEIYQGLFRLYGRQSSQGMARALDLLDQALAEAGKAKGPPVEAPVRLAAQQAKAMIMALRDDGALAMELVRVAFQGAGGDGKLQFDTLHLLAALADKHRKLEEAEKFYRQSLRTTGVTTEALVYAGWLRVLWKEHKYEDVVQVCREGLVRARATNQVLFHMEMAKAQARLGRHEPALKAVDEALNKAGDRDKAVVRQLRVRLLIQAEKYDQAEKECQALLDQAANPDEALEAHYLLSTLFSVSRQMAKAEEQLELILKADPNNATAHNDLGYIWADQNKNLNGAEEMVRQAIELDRRQRKLARDANPDQDNAAYIDSLGWVFFRQGKLDEACRQLELASSLPDGADDPTVWDHLGDVYARLERLDRARAAWEKAVSLFEKENRRKMEERHRELRRKLQTLDAEP